MQLQISRISKKRTKMEIDNLILSDGTLSYWAGNEETSIDLDDIDTLVITDSPAPDLAAENARLDEMANYLSEVIADERAKSQNRKEVNGILARKNKNLAAENARLKAVLEGLLRNVVNLSAQTSQAPSPAVERNIQAAHAALGGE